MHSDERILRATLTTARATMVTALAAVAMLGLTWWGINSSNKEVQRTVNEMVKQREIDERAIKEMAKQGAIEISPQLACHQSGQLVYVDDSNQAISVHDDVKGPYVCRGANFGRGVASDATVEFCVWQESKDGQGILLREEIPLTPSVLRSGDSFGTFRLPNFLVDDAAHELGVLKGYVFLRCRDGEGNHWLTKQRLRISSFQEPTADIRHAHVVLTFGDIVREKDSLNASPDERRMFDIHPISQ